MTASFSSEALQLPRETLILLAACQKKPPREFLAALSAEDFSRTLAVMAERHGTSALLAEALGSTGELSAEFTSGLRRQARTIAVTNLMLTAEFSRLAAAFAAAAIPLMPYKGPLFAERVYRNIALRRSGDLDLIIAESDLGKGLEVLRDLGYGLPAFSAAERRIYERAEAGYECSHPQGFVADLHFRIVSRHFCVALDNASLFARSRMVSYSGGEVRALSAEDELIVLALHGSKHCWERLIWLCDVARLIASEPELDWDLVLHRAAQLHIQRVVLLAASLTATYLGANVPTVVLASCHQDQAIHRLANVVVQAWQQSQSTGSRALHRWRFVLAMRERARDRWKCALRYAMTPGLADWRAVALPSWLSVFYPAVRGIRLLSQITRNLASQTPIPIEDTPGAVHAN